MPAALLPPSPRPLNPTQIALLKALCQLGSTREAALATSLASHRLPAYRDRRGWALNSWTMEIRLQAELLQLYGLVTIHRDGGHGPVYAPSLSSRHWHEHARAQVPVKPRTAPLAFLIPLIFAGSLSATGCSYLPSFLKPAEPLPQYGSERVRPPDRIEQFRENGSLVYRFCVASECPAPTPKRPALAPVPRVTTIEEIPASAQVTPKLVAAPQTPTPVMKQEAGEAPRSSATPVASDTPVLPKTATVPTATKTPDAPAATSPAAKTDSATKQGSAQPLTASTPSVATGKDLDGFVSTWAQRWAAKDAEGYFSLYAKDFWPSNGGTPGDWLTTRRNVMTRPGALSVDVDTVKIVEADDKATVRFWQTYRSKSFSSRVLKELKLVRDGQDWKIQRERVIPVTA